MLEGELAIAEYGAEHVVEVVGDAARERPERLELLRLMQLRRHALVAAQLAQEGDEQHRGQRRDDECARDVRPGERRASPRGWPRSLRPTARTAG